MKLHKHTLLAFIVASAGALLAAEITFTVDDDRSQCPDADYTNIVQALAACNNTTNTYIMRVYTGQYRDSIILSNNMGMIAAAGNKPVINVSNAASFAVALNQPAKNIIVDGFTISGNNLVTNGFGTWMTKTIMTNIHIRNCTIERFLEKGITYLPFSQNLINCSVTNCTIRNVGGDGFYISMDSGATREFVFENNRIYNCGLRGFYYSRYGLNRSYCPASRIVNNLFVNNPSNYGCHFGSCNDVEILFANNTVSGNSNGVYGAVYAASRVEGNIIYGNLKDNFALADAVSVHNDYTYARGTGGIDADPLFLETDDPDSPDFYRLGPGSPCISPFYGATEMGAFGKKVLTIGNEAGFTTGSVVTLQLESSAPTWTGAAANMRLSNDGLTWRTSAFESSHEWDLADPAAGGSTNQGIKVVFYQPLDAGLSPLAGSSVVSNWVELIDPAPTVAILPNPSAYWTVQSAMDASTNAGDVIEIQSSRTYLLKAPIILANSRTLKAKDGETPILRAVYPGIMMQYPKSSGSICLQGLTLDGGGFATRGISGYTFSFLTNCTVRDCTIRNIDGNGFYWNWDSGLLQDFTFERNKVYNCSNGVWFARYNTDRAVCSNNVFRSNLFFNNTNQWGMYVFACNRIGISFENNTIVNNLKGAYLTATNEAPVRNCIIYNNISSQIFTLASMSINYCNIQGYAGAGSAGNIDQPPLFANAPATNYMLSPRSPCINTGTNLPWMDTAKDLGGYPRVRPTGGAVDMGAYEFFPAGSIFFSR